MMKSSIQKGIGSRYDFTEGGIIKPILFFSLPVLVGNIFTALYNVVDSIVVGQAIGSSALAAVNASFVVTTVCTAVYAGFGMGSAVLIGQLFGARKLDDLNKAAATAFIGAFSIGIIMSVVGLLISRPVLLLVNTPADILEQADIYLKIIFLGCTTQLFYMMGSGILRGLGDSKYPMYLLILCALLNIILDIVFVVIFHWGCAGVAAGTVISQAVSGILVVIRICMGGYGNVRLIHSQGLKALAGGAWQIRKTSESDLFHNRRYGDSPRGLPLYVCYEFIFYFTGGFHHGKQSMALLSHRRRA